MQISVQEVDFLISTDAVVDADIYFQYLRMWMLKMMWISAEADILSTSHKQLCLILQFLIYNQ